MIVLSTAEKEEVRKYHAHRWNNYQIAQKILQERADTIYFNMRRAIVQETDKEDDKNMKEVQL